MKTTEPFTALWSTVKIWAPATPIFFIASRSAVIPALETFPLTQCHQVLGWALAVGCLKWDSSGASALSAKNGEDNNRAKTGRIFFMGRESNGSSLVPVDYIQESNRFQLIHLKNALERRSLNVDRKTNRRSRILLQRRPAPRRSGDRRYSKNLLPSL